MIIAVDAFGGDNAPTEIIRGAAAASAEYGVGITLTGNSKIIEKVIASEALAFPGGLKILHTEDVITMEDEPTSVIRAHSDSSMALALKEVAEGRADAFVSAGSTGAVVVGGTLIVKRIKGVRRPALAGFIPSPAGSYMLMDMGANSECRPEMLCQFGLMASAYLERVEGRENPSVGLLNIGSEESKGDTLRLETYELMKNAPMNFAGNIEAREMPKGVCDAIITDGFTGNIALKLMEGTTLTLFKLIKGVMYKSLPNKLSALVLKKDFSALRKMMDSDETGGAPLLGVSKPVIKAHGSSDARAFKNAVHQAVIFAEKDVVGAITAKLSQEANK